MEGQNPGEREVVTELLIKVTSVTSDTKASICSTYLLQLALPGIPKVFSHSARNSVVGHRTKKRETSKTYFNNGHSDPFVNTRISSHFFTLTCPLPLNA